MTSTSDNAIFRSHRHAAAGAHGDARTRPGIYHQLAGEWSRLAASSAVARTVRRWAATEPLLAAAAGAGDVVDAIDTADPAATDELIRALLRLFHDGHQLAGRILLQAMLPKLSHLARARRSTGRLDEDDEDRRCNVVAAFWEVLARPGTGRTANLAGSLALDTLNLVTVRRGSVREESVDPGHFEQGQAVAWPYRHVPDIATSVAAAHEPNDYWPLEALVSWGVHAGAITSGEAAALTAVQRAWPRRSADVAAELGLSPANLRQRCSRATRSLAAAVHSHAAQVRALELAS